MNRLEAIVAILYELEKVIGHKLPVLDLEDIGDAFGYIKSGAFGSIMFIVCNKNEVTKAVSERLDSYRELRDKVEELEKRIREKEKERGDNIHDRRD